jgi:hypothetical protein
MFLGYSERLQLIGYVITAQIPYSSCTFKLPTTVINKLIYTEKTVFVVGHVSTGKKCHNLTTCIGKWYAKPEDEGGLGVSNLRVQW